MDRVFGGYTWLQTDKIAVNTLCVQAFSSAMHVLDHALLCVQVKHILLCPSCGTIMLI